MRVRGNQGRSILSLRLLLVFIAIKTNKERPKNIPCSHYNVYSAFLLVPLPPFWSFPQSCEESKNCLRLSFSYIRLRGVKSGKNEEHAVSPFTMVIRRVRSA